MVTMNPSESLTCANFADFKIFSPSGSRSVNTTKLVNLLLGMTPPLDGVDGSILVTTKKLTKRVNGENKFGKFLMCNEQKQNKKNPTRSTQIRVSEPSCGEIETEIPSQNYMLHGHTCNFGVTCRAACHRVEKFCVRCHVPLMAPIVTTCYSISTK